MWESRDAFHKKNFWNSGNEKILSIIKSTKSAEEELEMEKHIVALQILEFIKDHWDGIMSRIKSNYEFGSSDSLIRSLEVLIRGLNGIAPSSQFSTQMVNEF